MAAGEGKAAHAISTASRQKAQSCLEPQLRGRAGAEQGLSARDECPRRRASRPLSAAQLPLSLSRSDGGPLSKGDVRSDPQQEASPAAHRDINLSLATRHTTEVLNRDHHSACAGGVAAEGPRWPHRVCHKGSLLRGKTRGPVQLARGLNRPLALSARGTARERGCCHGCLTVGGGGAATAQGTWSTLLLLSVRNFSSGGVGLGVSEEIFLVEGWVDCRSLMFWRVRCVVVVVVIVVDDGADTGGSTGGTETAQK